MYIHKKTCISPQNTFVNINIDSINYFNNNILKVIEPKYDGIPLNILRRMGKAVRMGIGAALPIANNVNIDGIIIGTSNGGLEDCIKFLNQIKEYNEGTLTPTNFVQGTPSAIASQICLLTKNNNYNITHVNRGLAFENALIDAKIFLSNNLDSTVLVGGLDEISSYNYNIEKLGGWYKNENIVNTNLYSQNTDGTIAGEGVAMFLLSNKSEHSLASISDIITLHTNDINIIKENLNSLILKYDIDVFLSGENGDKRLNKYYEECENILKKQTAIARFKHFCGEFPTASAISIWLASEFLEKQNIPNNFIKKPINKAGFNNILIYNNYKGEQHSFIVITNILN